MCRLLLCIAIARGCALKIAVGRGAGAMPAVGFGVYVRGRDSSVVTAAGERLERHVHLPGKAPCGRAGRWRRRWPGGRAP